MATANMATKPLEVLCPWQWPFVWRRPC